MLSASANKLSKLKERAAEYASLIMEELDPDDLGYIEVTISCSSDYLQTIPAEHLIDSRDVVK